MRPSWQTLVNAGLLALLAGCAEPGWEKPGADAARRDAALAQCRAEARLVTNREAAIDQDIASTMQRDWERGGISDTRRDRMRDRTRSLGEDLVDRCMAANGWVRAKPAEDR
jgi:hypothetical protein